MCVYTLPPVYGPFFCLVYLDHSSLSVSGVSNNCVQKKKTEMCVAGLQPQQL